MLINNIFLELTYLINIGDILYFSQCWTNEIYTFDNI